MGYDRGDSFPFDFELIGIPFGSKLKGKLSPRSYPIQCERKRKNSFLSVQINGAAVDAGLTEQIKLTLTRVHDLLLKQYV